MLVIVSLLLGIVSWCGRHLNVEQKGGKAINVRCQNVHLSTDLLHKAHLQNMFIPAGARACMRVQ
jgi:hypothetical protein